MIVEFWAILWFLSDCTFKQGMSLLPPQNLTLTSENFYTFLMWHPAPGSTNGTQYEVEIHNGNRSSPEWIKEASCLGNHLKVIQSCQLHLPDIHTHYYARARTLDGSRSSEWANSNTLQLYKDTIIGPLNLSLAVADRGLTVSVSMPQTPLKRSEIITIMKTLNILVVLYGDNKAPRKAMIRCGMTHTFENIKPNANYCVEATVIGQPAKEAVQCSKTPFVRADYVWAPYIIASLILAVFIFLGVVASSLLKHHFDMKSSEIVFPKSLTFLNTNLLTLRSILPLDDVSATSFSTMYFFSNHCMLEQPERCQIQLIPGGCNSQQLSVYCANGLCWKEKESIVLSSTAVDAHLSGQSLEDEYLTEGDSRTALEVLETSLHPLSVTGGLSPQGLGISSWEPTCEIGNTSGQLTLASLFRTEVSLDSLKLPNVLDLQELVQEPYAYIPMADSYVYPKAWVQQSTESLVCQEDCGLSNDTEDPLGSKLEGRATDTTEFPGYESHPFILFWNLKF